MITFARNVTAWSSENNPKACCRPKVIVDNSVLSRYGDESSNLSWLGHLYGGISTTLCGGWQVFLAGIRTHVSKIDTVIPGSQYVYQEHCYQLLLAFVGYGSTTHRKHVVGANEPTNERAVARCS